MTTPEEVIYKELWKIIWTKIFQILANRLWNWFYDQKHQLRRVFESIQCYVRKTDQEW